MSITSKHMSQQKLIAFAIDIDGTLCNSHEPIPSAREALELLERLKIPFVLLTKLLICLCL